jgi:hypothetical protein
MKAEILGSTSENSSTCYLANISLNEYIESLPINYKDYEVQREIVSNDFLDNLSKTILTGKHIPSLVLVLENDQYAVSSSNVKNFLEITDFKILDGLQRTYRLQAIYKTITFFFGKLATDFDLLDLPRISLSRRYSSSLASINSNSKILEQLIEFYKEDTRTGEEKLKSCFERPQWFEIWVGLTPEEQVNKMLVLNAGHKPVRPKHQLEIIFSALLPIFRKTDFPNFLLVREKEISSISYSKNRVVGQFHFSHLITAILSFEEGQPLTSNIGLIQKAQAMEFDFTPYLKYFNYTFLRKLVLCLIELDENLLATYNAQGTRWLGREIALVGTLAALGKYSIEKKKDPLEVLEEFRQKIVQHVEYLNLSDFENQRNALDLAKVNVGSVNKNAVFNAIYDLVGSEIPGTINWKRYFSKND